jgi:hypothetical protein
MLRAKTTDMRRDKTAAGRPEQKAVFFHRCYNPVRAMNAMQLAKIIKNTILICTP